MLDADTFTGFLKKLMKLNRSEAVGVMELANPTKVPYPGSQSVKWFHERELLTRLFGLYFPKKEK